MSKHDIPTYYGAEWSWVIYALNEIIRTAEKFFLWRLSPQKVERSAWDSAVKQASDEYGHRMVRTRLARSLRVYATVTCTDTVGLVREVV